MRKIIHIDMDAFYASVEQREDPSLVGKPLAVGFDGPRGVVSTASYEARKYGVHSAMSIMRAKQLCPHLIIVPCHFQLYKEVSAQVHEIFHEYTDLVEPISLDEAFLDVTENKSGIDLARDIALEIKHKIKERTRLTASAGISYNKFLAKIASDYRKPDGMTIVHPLRALAFIEGLPIEDFWGVGPKTAEKMHALGITNGLELRNQSLDFLTANFGKAGQTYYDFSRGVDERPVQPTRIRKSVSCEETFLTDLYDRTEIIDEIDLLIDDLMGRLGKSHFEGRTLTLKVKYYDFTQITRSISKEGFYTDRPSIREDAMHLLNGVEFSSQRAIRLLGLTVSNPIFEHATLRPKWPPTLFDAYPELLM